MTRSVQPGGQVVGLTSVDCRLFVLLRPSQQQIQVYDMDTLGKKRYTIQVRDLNDDTSSCGLTSCANDKCLYVSDYRKDVVYKVLLAKNSRIFPHTVGKGPMGLSINTSGNLIVACWSAKIIQEYTTRWSLVREIRLQSSPYCAIQLTSGQFVVSHGSGSHYDVSEVTSGGRVVASYKNTLHSTGQQKFSWPRHLAVDKSDKCILVADCKNSRIVMINRSKKTSRDLNVDQLKKPSCVCYDESRNRLFVGEFDDHSRVMAFDNFTQSS